MAGRLTFASFGSTDGRSAPRAHRHAARPFHAALCTLVAETADAGPPIDPVCRMIVNPERCAGRLVHEKETYFFCSFRAPACSPSSRTSTREEPAPGYLAPYSYAPMSGARPRRRPVMS
jgi:hypothetical protein